MQVTTPVVLTDREERFLWALANGLRQTRAATVAGYSIGSARNLLAKPHIRAAIAQVAKNTAAIARRLEQSA